MHTHTHQIPTRDVIKMSQPLAGRLIGGKQLDLPLKKVMLSDSCSREGEWASQSTCLGLRSSSPLPLASGWSWCLRAVSCFSGSGTWSSRALEMYSLRGESLKLRILEEEMMISLVCSSCVDGNSSRNSFLHCRAAVPSLRVLYTGNASRFGSSRVSNFRPETRPTPTPIPPASSSKYPKKEVFSGESCRRSDSAFLRRCGGSGRSAGRLKRGSGCLRLLERERLGKKSRGSLLRLILMRSVRPLGSLSRPRLPAPSRSSLSSSFRIMRFSRQAASSSSICIIILFPQK